MTIKEFDALKPVSSKKAKAVGSGEEEKFLTKDVLMRLPLPLVNLLDMKADAGRKSRAEVVREVLWAFFTEEEKEEAKAADPRLTLRKPGRVRKPRKRSFTNPHGSTVGFEHPIKGNILLAPYETVEWEED